MKFRKVLSFVAMGALAGILFTGCGDTDNSDDTNNIRLGMITNLNASEKKVDEILSVVEKKSDIKLLNYKTRFYKNLSTMQMSLDSGNVDEISTYDCVSNYLMAHNPKYQVAEQQRMALSDSFCFAVRKDSEALKKDLNKTLEAIKKDGTLDKLVKEYITDMTKNDPPSVEIPHIDGADTIKVAVTGDLPPLDLVLADGKPAGFNTALLAEIAKRLNRNIEILDIDGDARATALSSGKADVVFWAILPIGEERPRDIDTPEGAVLTAPYFTDKIVHLKTK